MSSPFECGIDRRKNYSEDRSNLLTAAFRRVRNELGDSGINDILFDGVEHERSLVPGQESLDCGQALVNARVEDAERFQRNKVERIHLKLLPLLKLADVKIE